MTPADIQNITMTGGWVAVQLGNGVSTVMIQCRTSADIRWSPNAGGERSWTIKADTGFVAGSFNFENQTLYLNGAVGLIAEIVTLDKP